MSSTKRKRTLADYRRALQEEFGPDRFKIAGNGRIDVQGTMPNTSAEGWYVLGEVGNPETDYAIFGNYCR